MENQKTIENDSIENQIAENVTENRKIELVKKDTTSYLFCIADLKFTSDKRLNFDKKGNKQKTGSRYLLIENTKNRKIIIDYSIIKSLILMLQREEYSNDYFKIEVFTDYFVLSVKSSNEKLYSLNISNDSLSFSQLEIILQEFLHIK